MSQETATAPVEAASEGHREGVTIEEAARLLGVSINTVRRRVKRGDLPVDRVSTPQGYTYRVYLPGIPPGAHVGPWAPGPAAAAAWNRRPDGHALGPEAPPDETAGAQTGSRPDMLPATQADVRGIREMLEVLARQLQEKDRQIHELHILLQQAQQQGRALAVTGQSAPRRPWWWRLLKW